MNLLIGTGTSHHPDYIAALNTAFAQATQGLYGKLPTLLIVHLGAQYPLNKVLDELKKLSPQALVVGSVTPFQIHHTTIANGVMITAIFSEDSYVLDTTVENLSPTDPTNQLNQALTHIAVPNQPFPNYVFTLMNTITNWEKLYQVLHTSLPNTSYLGSLSIHTSNTIFINQQIINQGIILLSLPRNFQITPYLYHTASVIAPITDIPYDLPRGIITPNNVQILLPQEQHATHYVADQLSNLNETITQLKLDSDPKYKGLYCIGSLSRYNLMLNYGQEELKIINQQQKKATISGAITTCPIYINSQETTTNCIWPHHQLILGIQLNNS